MRGEPYGQMGGIMDAGDAEVPVPRIGATRYPGDATDHAATFNPAYLGDGVGSSSRKR